MRSYSKKVMWLWLVKYRTDQKCLCGIFLPFLRNLPEPGRVVELLLKSISEQYHVPLDDRKAENSNGQQEAAESEENNG